MSSDTDTDAAVEIKIWTELVYFALYMSNQPAQFGIDGTRQSPLNSRLS
jgi:hypothetical protein